MNELSSHEDIQHILDVLDQFRKEGIDEHVPLPQPVVSGDTSSGKSSVLQRLTDIPFPSGENVVTRFPTLISMRREDYDDKRISIESASTRAGGDRMRLKRYRRDLTSLDDYGSIYDEVASMLSPDHESPTGLMRDVLRVDISGPKCSPLCLIDLPGLIQTRRRNITEQDKQMSHDLVEEYLKNPSSIILCVVSATNDYVNQDISDKARKYDPEGVRTMGIITKVDAVQAVQQKGKAWMDLLQNTENGFKLGWCPVVNNIEDVEDASAEEIDDAEREFIDQERFAHLHKSCLGLDALRTRLNLAVHDNNIKALPSIRQQLQIKLSSAQDGLKNLGEGRSDNTSMRAFLVNLSTRFHQKASNALVSYSIGQDAWFDEVTDIRRLRTKVAELNDHFTDAMLVYGAGRRIDKLTNVDPGWSEATEVHRNNTYSHWARDIQLVRRGQALTWVQSEIESMRGSELPGEPIPGIETCLHRQLIVKWEELADEHLKTVSKMCDTFLQHLLRDITGTSNKDVFNGLYAHVK
ncbi:hypothetical protein EJ03DRAFT_302353 [Teratosphaeria nubilosa]|uniref:Dynamin-type G domain-containing protein n=1 Tax=Teratosphaeria nubilosa TaxID=161662 RepID=A0A6G1KW29_9PEZI|nr:hypothetical protein EJ03DRAFT_302353 [Teratosphaeria nubilosa]